MSMIVVWGNTAQGQGNVPAAESYVKVCGGARHCIALRSDGTVDCWGCVDDDENDYGQAENPWPNEGFTDIACGGFHNVALKSDGSVVAWGANGDGQCDVPEPNSGFVAIGAGRYISMGIKSTGEIVAWGGNEWGQCDVPDPNLNFTSATGGDNHTLGVKSDGSVIAWGTNLLGEGTVPSPNTNFRMVFAGSYYSIGLKMDGTLVAWGTSQNGECVIPSPNSGFTSVAAGRLHVVALRSDGSLAAWGANDSGESTLPIPNENFSGVGAGDDFSIGLKFISPPEPEEEVEDRPVFPTDISYGSSGGPEFLTEITELGGGTEQGASKWLYPKERWNVAYGIRSADRIEAMMNFFYIHRGRARPFLFWNHRDHSAEEQILAVAGGVYKTFQLVKTYESGGVVFTRKISKPKKGTVVVFVDSEENDDWTIDYDTGIVTFSNAPGTGSIVSASFEFYVWMRFDTDYLPSTLADYLAESAEVPLVEVR